MAASVVLRYRRKLAEQYIERLIALLDEMDGDPDLEDDDSEPEETDQNGDEQDCSHSEEEWSPYVAGSLRFEGSGIPIAHSMIRGAPAAQERADAHLNAAAPPLVYDFREMLK